MNKKFNKLVLNTVGKLVSRPILQNVLYEDGNLYATDAHVAIKMPVDAPKELRVALNPITFEVDNADAYPEVGRLFPKEDDAKVSVKVTLDNLKTVLPLLKANKGTKNNHNFVDVLLKDSKLTFTVNNSSVSIEVSSDKEFTIHFDDSILLRFVDGYITGATNMKKDKSRLDSAITFHYYQEVRPVLITSDFLDYLITPVRNF